jgi:hypothetical protein
MSYVALTMANLCYQEHPPLYFFRFYKGTNMHKEGLDPSLGCWTIQVLWLVRQCTIRIQIKNLSHGQTS